MSDRTDHDRRPRALRYLPIAGIAVIALVGAWFLRDALSFETLRAHRQSLIAFRDAHFVLTLGAFALAYVGIVALSLPGGLMATLTGGFLFGVWPGALINVASATAGAVVIFLAARWGLGDRLARQMGTGDGLVRRIKSGIDDNQWSMLFLIRLIPAVPFFVSNLVPALVGVPLYRYVLTTFFGIIPGTVVYTSVGAGLGEVFARGDTPDLGIIFEPQILLPILGLCVLAVLPMGIKMLRGRKDL